MSASTQMNATRPANKVTLVLWPATLPPIKWQRQQLQCNYLQKMKYTFVSPKLLHIYTH